MSEKEFDYQELEKYLIRHLGLAFLKFQDYCLVPKEYYGFDEILAIVAVTNAISDIKRSTGYHSKTGPSVFKIAGFCGRWVAHQRPIWTDYRRYTNPESIDLSIDLEQINPDFAVWVVQSILNYTFPQKLASDLSYCFEFRQLSGDNVTLLLEHSLKHLPKFRT